MEKCTIRKPMASSLLMMLMIIWQLAAVQAQTYDLPIKGSDVVRCGAGELTLTVSWSGTALNPDNIKWYTVPFYGEPIGTGLTFSTGYIEFTQTYFVDYIGEDGCSQCDRLLVRAVIEDQLITPQVIYPSFFYCNTADESFVPMVVGAEDGIWEIWPAATESFNTDNGSFNPFGLEAETYEVTYIPKEIEGCDSNPITVLLTVTNAPEQPNISYAGGNYCSNSAPVSVIQTGASGGTYSASPSGLSINSSSGLITPESSQPGSYTVTYLVPGGGGCAPVAHATSISITQYPTVAIAYSASAFTKNTSSAEVILNGTGDYSGGTFSALEGLSLNTTTGEIAPSASTSGSYTVTYSKTFTGVCSGTINAETTIEIYPLPDAAIAGETSVCVGQTDPLIAFTASDGAAPYLFTYTINNGPELTVASDNGENTVSISQTTEVAGAFKYELVKVTDNNGSFTELSDNIATITVNDSPIATFVYLGGSFCTAGTAIPTFTGGGIAGTFSATPSGLVFADTSTGEIDLASSTPGTYTVTNTIDTDCGIISETASIEVLSPTLIAISGEQSVIYGDETTYSGTSDPNFLYSWSITGEGSLTGATDEQSVNVSATGVGTYTLTLIVTNSTGCESSVDYEVTVGKAQLTVVPDNQSKFYDGAVFDVNSYSSSYTGFKFSDDNSVVSGNITYNGDAILAVAAGTYTINSNVDNLTATNYTFIVSDGGELVINKVSLTVAAEDIEVTYGDAIPVLTYTLSGFVNGEDASTANISGDPELSTIYTVTTPVADSPVTISVDGIGDLSATNYNFLILVDGLITITKKELSVTADDKFKGTGTDDPTFTVSYTGFVNDDDETSLDGTLSFSRVEGETSGTYTITPSGFSSSNYSIENKTGTLTIADVILESTDGEIQIAGYASLSAAFDKINDGTHQGYITVTIYADLTEPESATALKTSGDGSADYTSVSVISAKADGVTVTGNVTLGSTGGQ